MSFYTDSRVQQREEVPFQSTYDGSVDYDRELLLALLIRVSYSEPFRVADVYLKSSNLPRPIQIVNDIVFHIEDPVVQSLWNEVEQYRLLFHLHQDRKSV